MDVGSQTEWDERTPEPEIARRKESCRARLGIEIARWLMPGKNTVVVSEETEERAGRTVYTLRLRASVE